MEISYHKLTIRNFHNLLNSEMGQTLGLLSACKSLAFHSFDGFSVSSQSFGDGLDYFYRTRANSGLHLRQRSRTKSRFFRLGYGSFGGGEFDGGGSRQQHKSHLFFLIKASPIVWRPSLGSLSRLRGFPCIISTQNPS